MNFSDRFPFPLWNLIGWCVIVAIFLCWEIWGATHQTEATLTYLIRTTCASFKYGKFCLTLAWVVLGWHFLWYNAAWWKSLTAWLKG